MNQSDSRLAEMVSAGETLTEIARLIDRAPRTVKQYKRQAAKRSGYIGEGRLDVFLVRARYGKTVNREHLNKIVAPPHRWDTEKLQRLALLIAEGKTEKQAADIMGITRPSARRQVRNIFDMAGVSKHAELARFLFS